MSDKIHSQSDRLRRYAGLLLALFSLIGAVTSAVLAASRNPFLERTFGGISFFQFLVAFVTISLLASAELARRTPSIEARAELKKSRERIDELRTESRLSDTEEPSRPSRESELLDLESTIAFQTQAEDARAASQTMLRLASLIVVIFLLVGIVDLYRTEAAKLTTGDGIARAAVVGAVFYLAGQLFRRATNLEQRADDLDRAVVALRYGGKLAKDIQGEQNRDDFIKTVYQSHLSARVPNPAGEEQIAADIVAALSKRP